MTITSPWLHPACQRTSTLPSLPEPIEELAGDPRVPGSAPSMLCPRGARREPWRGGHRATSKIGRCCSQSSASSSMIMVRFPFLRARSRPDLISSYAFVRPIVILAELSHAHGSLPGTPPCFSFRNFRFHEVTSPLSAGMAPATAPAFSRTLATRLSGEQRLSKDETCELLGWECPIPGAHRLP